MEGRTLRRQPGGAVEQAARHGGRVADLAQVGLVGAAEVALAALRHPRDDDVVAGPHDGHALADLLDHACPLVTADEGCGPAVEGSVLDRQVGVAHARRAHADLHLAGVRRLDLDVVTNLE